MTLARPLGWISTIKRKDFMSKWRAASTSFAVIAAIAFLACSAASGGTRVVDQASSTAANCKVIGKGTPWTDSGQRGSSYTVVGNRATACALGIKWLARLTNMVGVTKTPPGWQCVAAVAVVGQCWGKAGAIFEWTAKRK
jgi:hypothetical protein